MKGNFQVLSQSFANLFYYSKNPLFSFDSISNRNSAYFPVSLYGFYTLLAFSSRFLTSSQTDHQTSSCPI